MGWGGEGLGLQFLKISRSFYTLISQCGEGLGCCLEGNGGTTEGFSYGSRQDGKGTPQAASEASRALSRPEGRRALGHTPFEQGGVVLNDYALSTVSVLARCTGATGRPCEGPTAP